MWEIKRAKYEKIVLVVGAGISKKNYGILLWNELANHLVLEACKYQGDNKNLKYNFDINHIYSLLSKRW